MSESQEREDVQVSSGTVVKVIYIDRHGCEQFIQVQTTDSNTSVVGKGPEIRAQFEAYMARIGGTVISIQVEIESSSAIKAAVTRPALRLVSSN